MPDTPITPGRRTTIVKVTPTTVTVAWEPASVEAVDQLQIRREGEGDEAWTDVVGAASSPSRARGLDFETAYEFRVRQTPIAVDPGPDPDPDPDPGPDPEPESGLSHLYPTAVQPAQGMVRLTGSQYGIGDPIFTPDMPSIGIAYWYRRERTGDREYYIYQERALGAVSAGWVGALEIRRSSDPVPYAAAFAATRADGTIGARAVSTITLPDDRLVLILAWRTPTEIGISVDGEDPVIVPFTPPNPLPMAHSMLVGNRHEGEGPFAPGSDRTARGDHFSAGFYLGLGPDRPFDEAARDALLAAGSQPLEGVPEIASGTLHAFFKFDTQVIVDQVGGQKSVRFLRGPTLVDSPVKGTSGSPALDGGKVYSFGEGSRAFVFNPAEAPVVQEAPRRLVLTSSTRGSRPQPALIGTGSVDVGIQGYIPIAAPGAADSVILRDVRADGTSVGWELVEGRYPAIRARDASGDVVAEVIADDTPYHEREILTRFDVEFTTDFRGYSRTRLELVVDDGGHRLAEGDSISFSDPGWPGNYTITWVSDDNESVHVVRDGFGHALPEVGSRIWANGQEPRATSTTSETTSTALRGRFAGMRVSIDEEGEVRLYAGGRLIRSGAIDPALVSAPAGDGASCWLGGPPGSTPKAMQVTRFMEGRGLSDARRSEMDARLGVLVDGQDGWLDDGCWIDCYEHPAIDRVCAIDHLVEWHLMNPDGSDHIPNVHATTGQSQSRATTLFSGRPVGDPGLTETTVYPTMLTIWPKLVSRDGTLNPGRTDAPSALSVPITRRPLGALGRNLYVSSSAGGRSDAASNLGTDPSTPFESLAVAVDRAGPFDRILLKSGDSWSARLDNRGTGTTNGNQAIGRVRFEVDGASPATVLGVTLAGGVRTYLRGINASNGTTTVWSVSGALVDGVHSNLVIRDCEAFSGAGGGSAFINSNYWCQFGIMDGFRIRNAEDDNSDQYGYFFGASDGLVMLGCDFRYRVQGSGSHVFRAMGATRMVIEHVPALDGFPIGNRLSPSIRGEHRKVQLADWGSQSPRNFFFLDVPARIQSRSNLSADRIAGLVDLGIWIANGIAIRHCRNTTSATSTAALPSASEMVSARLRLLGFRNTGSNSTPYANNTIGRCAPSTGPWRSVAQTSTDFGPAEAPDIGAIHVGGGLVRLLLEGYPHSAVQGFRRCRLQRKPALAGDDAWQDVIGIGAIHATDAPPLGMYRYRATIAGSDAYGAVSGVVAVTDPVEVD